MNNSFDVVLQDLSTTKAELQRQLGAIERAESALQEVNGSAPSPAQSPSGSGTGERRGPGRPPGSGSTGSTTTRRGRKGNRAEQAVSLIERTPGITIPDIAKAMKIEPNYLYRVVPKLEKEGKVRKEGQGWVAVGTVAA